MVGDLGLLSGSCIVTRLAHKGKFENRLYCQVRRSGNDADRRYRKAEWFYIYYLSVSTCQVLNVAADDRSEKCASCRMSNELQTKKHEHALLSHLLPNLVSGAPISATLAICQVPARSLYSRRKRSTATQIYSPSSGPSYTIYFANVYVYAYTFMCIFEKWIDTKTPPWPHQELTSRLGRWSIPIDSFILIHTFCMYEESTHLISSPSAFISWLVCNPSIWSLLLSSPSTCVACD